MLLYRHMGGRLNFILTAQVETDKCACIVSHRAPQLFTARLPCTEVGELWEGWTPIWASAGRGGAGRVPVRFCSCSCICTCTCTGTAGLMVPVLGPHLENHWVTGEEFHVLSKHLYQVDGQRHLGDPEPFLSLLQNYQPSVQRLHWFQRTPLLSKIGRTLSLDGGHVCESSAFPRNVEIRHFLDERRAFRIARILGVAVCSV